MGCQGFTQGRRCREPATKKLTWHAGGRDVPVFMCDTHAAELWTPPRLVEVTELKEGE